VSEHKREKEDDKVDGREGKIEVLNVKMVYVNTETCINKCIHKFISSA
jgi:hypothetical protein